MTDATYELDYALLRLKEAIDFAEAEGEFAPVRKWAKEVEKAARPDPTRAGQFLDAVREHSKRVVVVGRVAPGVNVLVAIPEFVHKSTVPLEGSGL